MPHRTSQARRLMRIAVAVAVAYAAVAAWSCVLLWDGWRGARFRRELVVADVGVAIAVLITAATIGAVAHAPSLKVLVVAEVLAYAGTLLALALAAALGRRLLRTAADAFEQRRVLHDTQNACMRTAVGIRKTTNSSAPRSAHTPRSTMSSPMTNCTPVAGTATFAKGAPLDST